MTKQKLDIKRTSELGEPFPEKSDLKNLKKTEDKCQNAACEKKPTSAIWNVGSNNGLQKPKTKLIQEMEKNSKNQREIPA